MSVFGSDAPQEDPAIKQQRLQQQQAADSALGTQIQTDLQRQTRARLQRFGFGTNSPQPNDPSVTPISAPRAPRGGPGIFGLVPA